MIKTLTLTDLGPAQQGLAKQAARAACLLELKRPDLSEARRLELHDQLRGNRGGT